MSESITPNPQTESHLKEQDLLQDESRAERREQDYTGQFEVSIDREQVVQSELPNQMKDWLVRLPERLDFQEPVTLIVGPNGSGKTQFARALIETVAVARNKHIEEAELVNRQTTDFNEDSPAAQLLPSIRVSVPNSENRGAFPTNIDGTEIMHETKRWAEQMFRDTRAGHVRDSEYTHRKSTRQLFEQALEDLRTRRVGGQKRYPSGAPSEYPDALVVLDEPEQGLDPEGQLGLPEAVSNFLDKNDTLLVPTNNIVLARISDLPRLDLSHPERGIHRPTDYGELLTISSQA